MTIREQFRLATRIFLILLPLQALAGQDQLALQDDRVRRAEAIILDLCLASGTSRVEIKKQNDNIVVGGPGKSIQINESEFVGIIGGISKEMTPLMSRQATEVRSCTQKYIPTILQFINSSARKNEGGNYNYQNHVSRRTQPVGPTIFVHSQAGSALGYPVSDALTRRLKELGCLVTENEAQASIDVEIENVEFKGPYPTTSDYVTWVTSVGINISIKDAESDRLFLVSPFRASVVRETNDPMTSKYSAALEATNLLAGYINANRSALTSIR